MNTITDYLNEIEFATSKVLEAIWTDYNRVLQLTAEIEKEAKIVDADYRRTIHIQETAEDADDLMLGVGIYWENYFGRDKELFHKNKNLKDLNQRLNTLDFSINSLCGNILEYAKKGVSVVYGKPEDWPCGKKIGSQCLSQLILLTRNQSTHVLNPSRKTTPATSAGHA